MTFDILVEQDERFLRLRGLITAVQQISVLHAKLNRVFEDGSQPRSCKINSILSTRNSAPILFLAEYGFNHCEGLVEVLAPFGQLAEILDIDNGLGPCWPAF